MLININGGRYHWYDQNFYNTCKNNKIIYEVITIRIPDSK